MSGFADGQVEMSATVNTNVCSPGTVTVIHRRTVALCLISLLCYGIINDAYPGVIVLILTGDTVSVAAQIRNSSSKQTKTKFSLQQKIVYRANASTKVNDQSLWKMVGETIEPNSAETASCQFTVPADVTHTLQDCEIISVSHYLKVCNNAK